MSIASVARDIGCIQVDVSTRYAASLQPPGHAPRDITDELLHLVTHLFVVKPATAAVECSVAGAGTDGLASAAGRERRCSERTAASGRRARPVRRRGGLGAGRGAAASAGHGHTAAQRRRRLLRGGATCECSPSFFGLFSFICLCNGPPPSFHASIERNVVCSVSSLYQLRRCAGQDTRTGVASYCQDNTATGAERTV